MNRIAFHPRRTVEDVEEGRLLAPKFDDAGLIPCITSDADSGEVLMLGWMNAEALRLTLETGEAHYFSRSRRNLWHKGTTSGLVQRVVEARIDDDQDAIWLRVAVAGSGASCHVGYRSCFYRAVPTGEKAGGALAFTESTRTFDPVAAYGDAPNPTQL
ncbi:phosphoribosyl-AMP cyclohydrolase [Roseinatronobacter alkalisoli]|uniref:Phosphoribosyl-AMP cyclohydrolase n=1 Tax=Roseinatronobacter alkalisoli TaxID=3028235 RepID=A0ABT5TF61_9RHOB|nr:phosphoribosyl-AMP cyclohydrolase [Roseinatronobacter sp. HJB301]MDD7972812.1 phosphoribosyl-AMP cyclohydrolase [Roseinatronobacter sp. HJB301]